MCRKNADFNTLVPDESINRYYRYNRGGGKKWKFEDDKHLVPKFWTVNSGAVGTTKRDPENPSNSYVQLEKGYISQYFVGQGKGKLKISFRAKGKGKVMLWTSSYKNRKKGSASNGYDQMKETAKYRFFDLTGQWQTFSMETVKTGVPTERVAVRFEVRSAGDVVDLDDVYVTPVLEE